ncbi:MAG TPA: MauE/DoxX family redox-associated membrane protein [Thermoanaerobaculia bacterium]|nr:MauE/DoxX family redox-associated membrane protein [Thermoanaerobaculia bacterium]
MFDTSSFRIRYKAPIEKPLLIAAGPLLVAAALVVALWSRYVHPVTLGPWIGSDLIALLLPIAALTGIALGIESLFGVDEGYPWKRSVAATGAGIVGGTLLVGAWGKLLDPVSFADAIRQEGLTGWLDGFAWLPVTVPPLLVVAIEVALGSLLVLGVRKRGPLAVTALLVAFFLFLTGRAYWRDAKGIVSADSSCGCFGNMLDRTPAEAFWQDVALLVPGLLLATMAVISRQAMGRRVVFALAATVAAVTFGWFAPELPIDDLATRLEPGSTVASMCAGRDQERLCLPTLLPELQRGRNAVVLLDLGAEGMESEVERLNRYALAGGNPQLWVLASGTPEQSQAFFWKYGPSFYIHEAPPALLRPLYRALPRSFLVDDGTVTETWSGLPPFERWHASASEPVPGGAD